MNPKKGVGSDMEKFMAFRMKHLFGGKPSRQVELGEEDENHE